MLCCGSPDDAQNPARKPQPAPAPAPAAPSQGAPAPLIGRVPSHRRIYSNLGGRNRLRNLKGVVPGDSLATMTAQCAEYIWLDGKEGGKGWKFNGLRSKTKVLQTHVPAGTVDGLPIWNFDGSSTEQSEGHFSDCLLKPVFTCPDPVRGAPHILVMCEVMDKDMTPHPTNMRAEAARCRDVTVDLEPWFGMEQEYTMYRPDGTPLGFALANGGTGGEIDAQGPYYCGVGANAMFGRDLAEEHMMACVMAGLKISGINAEVMPGQWEFQIGPAGVTEVGDHLTVARYLLYLLGEKHGITCAITPKPVKGDWNGAGLHTNFSTKPMRLPGGIDHINAACEKLGTKVAEHIAVYGDGNADRLTGQHETCSIDEFKYGVADRGSSIRIPLQTSIDGYGYLEDRRPAANADPYAVAARMVKTVCLNE